MKIGRKVVIDQALCRKVELLVKGGAHHIEVGQICGISSATVSRIRSAGYNAEIYAKNTAARKAEEQIKAKALERIDAAIGQVREESKKPEASAESMLIYVPADKNWNCGQIKGQMQMDLKKPAEEHKDQHVDVEKLMRFYAAQIQKIVDAITSIGKELVERCDNHGEELENIIRTGGEN